MDGQSERHVGERQSGAPGDNRPTHPEDIVRVLGEFESGLEALRQLYTQRQALQLQLQSREQELVGKDSELAAKNGELLAKSSELDQRTRELELKSRELERLTRELHDVTNQFESQVKDLDEARAELSDREAELNRRLGDLNDAVRNQAQAQKLGEEAIAAARAETERQRELARREGEKIAQRAKDLDERTREVTARQGELERQREQLAQQAQTVATEREELARLREEFEQGREALQRQAASGEEARSAVEGMAQRLGEVERQLEQARARVEETTRELEEREGQLRQTQERLRQAESTLAGLQSEAAQAREELAQRRREVEQREEALRELAADAGGFKEKHAAVEGDLRALRERLGASEAQLGQRERELGEAREQVRVMGERAAALEAQHAQARRELESRAGERPEVHQELAKLRERNAALEQQVGNLWQQVSQEQSAAADAAQRWQRELESQRRAVEEARSQLREAIEAGAGAAVDGASGDGARAQDERDRIVASLREVIEEYEQLWAVERGEAARLMDGASANDADAVIAELRARLHQEVRDQQELRERVASTQQRAQKLEAKLREVVSASNEGRAIPGDWRTIEWMERRRRRLQVARDLVRSNSDKVRQGGEVLRKRWEQAEQVLRHRAELAQLREKLVEGERRLQRRSATSKASLALLCAVVATAILGAMSWAVARQVAPATYIAKATIAADGRGRELNSAELGEWREYHDKLLQDPRFHSTAADRFARVGLNDIASPATIKNMIGQKIHVESVNPGEMTLYMTDQGMARTERVLEAFTAAFASQANAALTARVDGSVTKVTQPATIAPDPLDNTRMYWALAMLGAACFVFFSGAGIIWRKLAGAKTRFELDTQAAAILDDPRWANVDALRDAKAPIKAA